MASSSGGGSGAVVEWGRPSQVIATVAGAWGRLGGLWLAIVVAGFWWRAIDGCVEGQVISSIGLSAMAFGARGYAKWG